jgi:hypothetical protein
MRTARASMLASRPPKALSRKVKQMPKIVPAVSSVLVHAFSMAWMRAWIGVSVLMMLLSPFGLKVK